MATEVSGGMLPKERAQIALEGGKPDRVPFLLECDYDYLAKAAGREPWQYTHADCLERARIHEAFYQRHPSDLWKCWGGPSRAALRAREIVCEEGRVFHLNKATGRRFEIDRRGNLLDEQREPLLFRWDGKPVPQREDNWLASTGYPRPVETEADIVELLGPAPPPEYWIEDGFLSTVEYLLPRYGGTHFLMFPLNTIFADALDLFGGFQEGLIALHTKPALFHRALEAIVEWKLSRLRAGASLGAPGTWMIEYAAGADVISPATYREFVFPYEQEVVREAHHLGLKVYLWYLGDVMPLLPEISRLELDALFPEQGRKGYEVDIVEIRHQLGDEICLIGFNDEQDLIEGDREALACEIQRQIEGAGRSGAFIMGTTIVTEEVPLEHMDFYAETVHRVGRYTCS
jgi:uroporphyrinogen-III decarboxylase